MSNSNEGFIVCEEYTSSTPSILAEENKSITFEAILQEVEELFGDEMKEKRVVKDALGVQYRPADRENNAADDLSTIATWIRHNMKSNIQKQIEGD